MSLFLYKEDNIKARLKAIYALDDIINNKSFSNEIIRFTINEVDDIDKSFYRKIIYGVVENLIYIDYIIGKLSSIKIRKIDRYIMNILRISIYEMNFLDTEAYASINEAVKNTKKFNYKSKGFVNAILRNFDRNKAIITNLDDLKNKDYDRYLSIKYSTNMDIVKYIKDCYKNYDDIIKSFVNTPKLNIRVNDMKISVDELKNRLESKGLKVYDSKISKMSLIIDNPIDITELKEFKDGYFTIQDQASVYVSEVLNPNKNSTTLDLCAAPGSKSTHLLQIMKDTGFVVSNDISKDKNIKIIENFKRLGFENYKITNYDASEFIEEFTNKFDYILVDAPCSGLGVIKRKPEIKLFRSIEDIKNISLIQSKILENAYKYMRVGTKLVYSTCTIGNIENRDIVDAFLKRHSDIKIVKDETYQSEILPNIENDGFYIIKMVKI